MQLLVVHIKDEKYAFNVDNIIEIINRSELTDIPESESYLAGIMHHRDEVLPILNFRSMINLTSYENEQINMLDLVKEQHVAWIKEFRECIQNDTPFTKALDPHACGLGKWIDGMMDCLKCNNEGFVNLIKTHIYDEHTSLHLDGKMILELSDKEEKIRLTETIIVEHYNKVIAGLNLLKENLFKLISAYERVIVYSYKGHKFGLIIDYFDKIVTIDDREIQHLSTGSLATNDLVSFNSVVHISNSVIMIVDFKDPILEASMSESEVD
jgi:chemotaxis signal transduction protein